MTPAAMNVGARVKHRDGAGTVVDIATTMAHDDARVLKCEVTVDLGRGRFITVPVDELAPDRPTVPVAVGDRVVGNGTVAELIGVIAWRDPGHDRNAIAPLALIARECEYPNRVSEPLLGDLVFRVPDPGRVGWLVEILAVVDWDDGRHAELPATCLTKENDHARTDVPPATRAR